MKLLFIDIETTPALVYVWQLFRQDISVDQIVEPTSILCLAWKWAGEKKVHYTRSTKRDGPEFARMIRKAHEALSGADAIVTYNGLSFDIPRINTELLKLKLTPPAPAHQIDLKLAIQRKFSATSHKLAFLGPYLEIGEKVAHEGWMLWRGCLDNKRDAWERMERYNKQDVVLLEKLYYRVLPWLDHHPNMFHYTEGDADHVCPNCGSEKLQRRGEHRTLTYTYSRYQCVKCGKWSRARLSTRQAAKPKLRGL